jgi:hypothetical protein
VGEGRFFRTRDPGSLKAYPVDNRVGVQNPDSLRFRRDGRRRGDARAVVTHDTALARQTRLRLWAEHLELSIEQVAGEPAQVIDDYWKPISKEQLARREAGEPLTHRLVRLAHVSRRSERLLGPLQGLLLDG